MYSFVRFQSLAPPSSYYYAISHKIDRVIETGELLRVEQNNDTVTVAYVNSIDKYPLVILFGSIFELVTGLDIDYIPLGIAFLMPLFLILRKMFDENTVAWSILLLAVGPVDLVYTTNFYALTSTIVLFLFCVYSAVRFLKRPSLREIVCPTIFLTFLVYSYYTVSFVVVISTGIFFILTVASDWIKTKRYRLSYSFLPILIPVALWFKRDFSRLFSKVSGLTLSAEGLIESGVFQKLPEGPLYCGKVAPDFGLSTFFPIVLFTTVVSGLLLLLSTLKKNTKLIRTYGLVFFISTFLLVLNLEFCSGTFTRVCALRVWQTTFLTSLQLFILCMPAAMLIFEKNFDLFNKYPIIVFWLVAGVSFTIISAYLGFAARGVLYFIFPFIVLTVERAKDHKILAGILIGSMMVTVFILSTSPIKVAEYLTPGEENLLGWASANIDGSVLTDLNFGGHLMLKTNNSIPIHTFKRQQDADIVVVFFNSNKTLLNIYLENKSIDYVIITHDMKTRGILPSDVWRQPIASVPYARYLKYELVYSKDGNEVFKVG